MNKQAVGIPFFILIVIFWIAAVGGWLANIFKLVAHLDNAVTGLFIARCIGVLVAPLGAVLGFV